MALADRVSDLEKLLGTRPAEDFPDLVTRSLEHEERIVQLEQQAASSLAEEAGPSVPPAGRQDQTEVLLEGVLDRVKELEEEVALLRRICSRQPSADQAQKPKIRVPEPKPFSGARNAKELENFVWDVEQYFLAAKVPEAERINLASMFLAGDAKLWWRTRNAEDRNAGRPGIENWESLQSVLKLVNSVIGMAGMGMILYSLWMMRVWYKQIDGFDSSSSLPWFARPPLPSLVS